MKKIPVLSFFYFITCPRNGAADKENIINEY